MKAIDFVLNKNLEKKAGKYNFSKIEVVDIIDEKDMNKARSQIDKKSSISDKEKIFVLSQDDNFNRKILEHKKLDALVLTDSKLKRSLRHENSGLNHVTCKIAADKNKPIIINLSDILSKKGKERAISLEKLRQNIKLCKKAKTKLFVASFAKTEKQLRDAYDIFALCISLGMPTDMAKNAVEKSI